MRRAEGREKSSVLFLGKGIIILSLVLASSLSFVLGYFVGKNMNPGDASQMQPAPAPIPYEQPPAATGEQAPVQPEKAGDQQQPLETHEVEPAPLKDQSEKPEKPGPGSSATQKNTGTVSGSNQKQVQQKTAVASQVKKNAEVTKEAPKTLKYTVQTGAFQNEADALALKAKLEKKGYKPRVIITQEKTREKFFKVMAGAYSVRKDAEILALKLKKSEGLKTFVTFYKNSEELR